MSTTCLLVYRWPINRGVPAKKLGPEVLIEIKPFCFLHCSYMAIQIHFFITFILCFCVFMIYIFRGYKNYIKWFILYSSSKSHSSVMNGVVMLVFFSICHIIYINYTSLLVVGIAQHAHVAYMMHTHDKCHWCFCNNVCATKQHDGMTKNMDMIFLFVHQ